MARVLIVEDDDTVAEVVVAYLDAAGMEVHRCADGGEAVAAAASLAPDLIVLDVMLPVLDGIEVLRRLRQRAIVAPVLMLTALGDEDDRIRGLEVGADDYLTKPFSPRELVLRVQSILRRTTLGPVADGIAPGRAEILRDGDVEVDLGARKASLAARPLVLTLREFDLLAHFVRNPDLVFSRDALLAAVWGWDVGDPSTVTVHVRRLREKIEATPQAPTRIVTVWGRGYRWESAVAGGG